MKNKYLIQFTLGQIIFILICLIGGTFLSFYLGARFGPEMLWGIKIESFNEGSLFPQGLSEEELEALIHEEQTQPLTFHQTLETGSFQEQQLLQKDVEKEEKKKVVIEEESFDSDSLTKTIQKELNQ